MGSESTRKLLVVDDDPNCRRILEMMLSGSGYEVRLACDGWEALEIVLSDKPPIIVTDWMMPRMDGLELIRKLRAELTWYPYILLMSGRPDEQPGLDIGADEFLAKPIHGEHLLPRLRAGERIVHLQERLREQNAALNLANQKLAELATTDPLSGLLNRRAFFDELRQEWARADRYELPLACLMFDIDHFKQVNDTYGHPAGDSVIETVGRLMKAAFRESDRICRYGGEEFCAFLTNTSLETACQMADRIRLAVAASTPPHLPADFHFSISVGVAERTGETRTYQDLVEHADQALLAAKQAGRNRLMRFDELMLASVGG